MGVRIINEISRIQQEHIDMVDKMIGRQQKSGDFVTPSGFHTYHMGADNKLNCNACDKAPAVGKKLMKCSGCGLAFYCCVDCQKADWAHHKVNCRTKQ